MTVFGNRKKNFSAISSLPLTGLTTRTTFPQKEWGYDSEPKVKEQKGGKTFIVCMYCLLLFTKYMSWLCFYLFLFCLFYRDGYQKETSDSWGWCLRKNLPSDRFQQRPVSWSLCSNCVRKLCGRHWSRWKTGEPQLTCSLPAGSKNTLEIKKIYRILLLFNYSIWHSENRNHHATDHVITNSLEQGLQHVAH